MGKKRKASKGSSEPKGPREYDAADSRLGPVNTYEDLADSQDEYFMDQDKIMFDDAPQSKKQRRQEETEEFLEASDEEVLGYDDDDSEDEEEEEEYTKQAPKSQKKSKSAEEEEDDDEEGGDSGWWGSSRKEYYNADQIETQDDALEEEKEARRLQKKKLAKMSEEDFIFNENEWLAPEAEEDEQKEVVTEVLKDVEIPEDMPSAERYRLLQARHPELDYLADELLELQPLLVALQKDAESRPSNSLYVVKYRILGCYVATLAMYFATLTSPARDSEGTKRTIDPAELRDHEVMTMLLECREAWQRVKDVTPSANDDAEAAMLSPPEEDPVSLGELVEAQPELTNKEKRRIKAQKAEKARAEKQAKEFEASLADLDGLLKPTKKTKKDKEDAVPEDGYSDFGEEEALDARAAAEKAARKKSLRFYTSQIVQKANRRDTAGRDAGGDMDIPYRERLKDRQARLNASAEKRGLKGSKDGADLGDDSDEDDTKAANAMRDDEDDYYDMVAAASGKKKADKAARAEALAAAGIADRVIEKEEVGEDGKRKITYQIQKNKGLAPKRKKDVRNPRVKKRKKFEEKQKKLRSMKAVYQGGEGRGGYQGELTGIKPGLIKSVKL